MQNYVRIMRERRGLTLDDVAKSLSCTKAQLSKLERGHIRLNDEWLDRLSRLYSCSVHDLIDDDIAIKTKQIDSDKQEMKRSFVTARHIGVIDSQQVGFVNYLSEEEQYPIYFNQPVKLDALNSGLINYHAYLVSGNEFPAYPEGSQLIFATANESTHRFITEGSVVLCSIKTANEKHTSECIRIIEFDELGIPHAVFKKRKSRQQLLTLADDMLLGSLTAHQKLKLIAEAEIDRPYKKAKNLSIPLCSEVIDIKAFLIKSIVDKI